MRPVIVQTPIDINTLLEQYTYDLIPALFAVAGTLIALQVVLYGINRVRSLIEQRDENAYEFYQSENKE